MDFRFDHDWALANDTTDSLFDKEHPDCKQWIISYLESEKRTVISLQEALEKNDYYKIAYIADMLYGHGGTVGYPLISIIGKAIVLAAQAKDNSRIYDLIVYLGKYVDFLYSQQ
jgi:hypothetical protein